MLGVQALSGPGGVPELDGVSLAVVERQDRDRAILGGDISASPYRLKAKKEQTACTYCEYRDVCGFDPDIEGSYLGAMRRARELGGVVRRAQR